MSLVFAQRRLSRMVDAWATRRTFDALVRATNNVKCVRWLGHPIRQYPLDAWLLQEVMRAHPEFERDVELERRYVMTAHVSGWLRRRADAAELRVKEPSAARRDRAA